MFLQSEVLPFMAHTYTLAATGPIKMRTKRFSSRNEANKAMYKALKRNHLHIKEVYDDNHFKTYICEDNIHFYVNREFQKIILTKPKA